jgi:hypothetical protein
MPPPTFFATELNPAKDRRSYGGLAESLRLAARAKGLPARAAHVLADLVLSGGAASARRGLCLSELRSAGD